MKVEVGSLPYIRKALGAEAVLGIPSIKTEFDAFRGECQVGKQVEASHKTVSQCTTNHTFSNYYTWI